MRKPFVREMVGSQGAKLLRLPAIIVAESQDSSEVLYVVEVRAVFSEDAVFLERDAAFRECFVLKVAFSNLSLLHLVDIDNIYADDCLPSEASGRS